MDWVIEVARGEQLVGSPTMFAFIGFPENGSFIFLAVYAVIIVS